MNDEELRLIITQQGADATTNAFKQVAAAQQRVIDATKTQTSASKTETSSLLDLEKALERGASGWDKYSSSKEKASKSQKEGGALGNIDRLFSATQRGLSGIGVGGEAGSVIGGVGDVAQLAKDFPALKESIKDIPAAAQEATAALGAGGVGFIGAIAVVAAAVTALNVSLADSKKQLDAATEANKTYYELLGSGTTTDQAQAQLDKTNSRLESEKAELASIENAFAGAFKDAQNQFGEAGGKLVYALSNVSNADDELTKRADELRSKIAADAAESQSLTQAVQNHSFAANDDTEAIKKATAARLSELDALAQQETQLQSLTRKGTTDQIKEQIAANQDRVLALTLEYNELVKLAATSDDAKKKLQDVSAEIIKLNNQNSELTNSILPIVQARDKEIQKAKDQKAAQEEIDKANAEATDDVAKHTDDLTKIQAKYAQSLTDLKASFDQANLDAAAQQLQKLGDLATEYAQQQADDQTKYQQDQTDAQTKLNDDLLKIQDEYHKRVTEIERAYTLSSQDAIQNRDAVALDAAQRKRDDDLASAQDNAADQTSTRQKQYQQELRDLQTNFQRQQAERKRDYDRRVQEAQIAFTRESQQRQQKYERDLVQLAQANQREIAESNAAYNKQLSDLSKYLSARSQTEQGYFGAILNYASQTKARIDALLNGAGAVGSSIFGGSTGSPVGGGTPAGSGSAIGGRLPGFAAGGLIQKTGLALVHRGELVLNRRQQPMAGVNLSINGMGLTRQSLLKEVERQLNVFWDAYERA